MSLMEDVLDFKSSIEFADFKSELFRGYFSDEIDIGNVKLDASAPYSV